MYLSASAAGADIEAEDAVDPVFLANVRRIATVLYSWVDGFSPPQIHAPTGVVSARANGRLMPYTGGLDSTFSLLSEQERIDGLLNVAGFDYPADSPVRESVQERLSARAQEKGIPLLVVETNIREFTDTYVHHTKFNHASIFAAIGHLTKSQFGHLLIPSSHPADMPAGSHFTLDPLWSASDLEVVHHGADTARVEKAVFLSGRPDALNSLKVCSNKKNPSQNCGVCYKCVATMTTLAICGVREANGLSKDKLTFLQLGLTPLTTQRSRRVALENIRLAEYLGAPNWFRMTLLLNYSLATRAPSVLGILVRIYRLWSRFRSPKAGRKFKGGAGDSPRMH